MAAGALIGLALGGAYLAGGMARDGADHARIARLAQAAAQGYSDEALHNVAAGGDLAAVALASRLEGADLGGLRPSSDDTGPFAKVAVGAAVAAAFQAANPPARPFQANMLNQARELECLSQAVYYEARGETPAGQAAVAQVVLNRVRHPAFPKSVCGVVFQGAQNGRGCQFSFACDGSLRQPVDRVAWRRASRIAARAFDGHVMSAVGGATHFHVTSVQPGWTGLMRVAQVGAHVFYKFTGRTATPKTLHVEPEIAPAPEPAPQVILASAILVEPGKPEARADAAKAAEPVALVTPPDVTKRIEPAKKPEPTVRKAEPAPAPTPVAASAAVVEASPS